MGRVLPYMLQILNGERNGAKKDRAWGRKRHGWRDLDKIGTETRLERESRDLDENVSLTVQAKM
jgi:hypothetical protein